MKTKQSGHRTAAAVDKVEMAKHSFLGKLKASKHTTEWPPHKFGAAVFKTDPLATTALFAGQLGVKAAKADCKGLEG